MTLSARIKVARRFQRAIRIDADLTHPAALDGFVCPPSVSELLISMARHVTEDGQGAFTWTGTYGGGKSTLAIALSAVLGPDGPLKARAVQALGKKTAARLWNALPPRKKGWRVLPVVGRREPLVQVMGEAIENAGFLRNKLPVAWTEQRIISSLQKISAQFPRVGGGLIVFVDEMGKFLETSTPRFSIRFQSCRISGGMDPAATARRNGRSACARRSRLSKSTRTR